MDAAAQLTFIASAADALEDISAREIAHVSAEVRRSITRHGQIVKAISDAVAARRSHTVHPEGQINQDRIREGFGPVRWVEQNGKLQIEEYDRAVPKRPVMDRRGEPMSNADTDELNRILESYGAGARYRSDGTRYEIVE